jgi:hypothetical protein
VATALTATGSSLLWYTVPTGGTGTSAAPVPSTAVAGSFNYYVSQSNSCGEGPRAPINVLVTATPVPPAGLSVTGITNAAAVLHWATAAGVFYTVDYKAAASATWINIANAVTAGSVSVSGLSASTLYDWRVTANCATTTVNNYTAAQFTTSSHNSHITVLKDGFGIKISPDPVIGTALVDYIVPGSGTVTLTLINAYGQTMQTLFSVTQPAGQYDFTITNQLNALAKGCYFLRVQQNGKGYFVEFVKQ